MYVVLWETRYQDGREDGAKCFAGIDEALAMIETSMNGFARESTDYRLFKLGEEIPLETADEVRKEVIERVTKTVRVKKVKKVK